MKNRGTLLILQSITRAGLEAAAKRSEPELQRGIGILSFIDVQVDLALSLELEIPGELIEHAAREVARFVEYLGKLTNQKENL